MIENRRESIFVELFQEISTLNGLSLLVLDRLKQKLERRSRIESDSIYIDALEKIERLTRTIKATIELNKMKIHHIDRSTTIIDAFQRFEKYFKVKFFS